MVGKHLLIITRDTILVKKDKFSQLILNNQEFKNINYKYEKTNITKDMKSK